MNMKTLVGAFILLLIILSASQSQPIERKALYVTVYNNNLGVIRDIRNFNIKSGISEINMTDVAQLIDPTSVNIKFDGQVLEQNYRYDLVSLMKILEKYIDKSVSMVSEQGKTIEGTLLSINNSQIVLRTSSGGLLMIPDISKYQITVGSLPEGLITKPSLVWKINSKNAGNKEIELSYQTQGMSWHTEYVAVLDKTDTKIDLNSWVSIENNSGATYPEAVLKLVAGDVNIIQPQPFRGYIDYMEKNAATFESAPQLFEEKAFFEYHIYNLKNPTTINQNETKQISLFEAKNINVTKKYLYRSGSYYRYYSPDQTNKVAVVIEFENKEKNGLGIPFPKGKVRLNKSDGQSLEFIGEDMIDHTPKDEKIKLKVGDAFDIVAEEKEVDHQSISDKVQEYTYEVKIKNRKDENIEVEVERTLGRNWDILSSNISYEKKDSQTVIFKVKVDKNKEQTLNFKVRYAY
ncbi:MAG: DUF4139 domain-containing protein [Candidatus Kapabacteria bacterium]|nr:DUF4139 domain-containing protein [Candidatus Kapabacteria bacterium]